MAERSIVRGVRLGTKTYTPGMEGELATVISPAEAERLSAKGYLTGKWATATSAPVSGAPKEDLDELTLAELKDRARDAQIQGFSTMNKADLVDALGGVKEK